MFESALIAPDPPPEDEAVAARITPHGAVDVDYLLRLGDDALILGQRLGEWCGHAPALEVDLSLANLALDLIGEATLLLGEAGDTDRLAFHRDVLDFRNCLLVEQPNGDFAQTIARQLLYSTWQHMLLQRLTQSSDRFLREFAAKAVKEIAYHRELASEWTVRLGDGTEESARRMAEGLDWCWRFVPELFEVDARRKRSSAASRSTRAGLSRIIAARSWRCWPKRNSPYRPTSGRSSAAAAATTASISAICSPRCNFCRAPIPTQ